MTGRIGVAIVSTTLAVGLAACTGFYEIPVETPIQAKIDVTNFQRILVAGFVGGGTRSIDTNTETARLLRSQLRSKQDLRVVDADAMPLAEEVDKRLGRQSAPLKAGEEEKVRDEKELAGYDTIFSDAEFWKKVGDEYQSPLIVTGTILFTEVSKSGVVSKPKSVVNELGQETFQTVREYSDLKGYALSPKFVFIDGRTGEQLHSETYHEEALYPAGQTTPALSSYFEMMDKLLPSFLNTLSTQKIRGSRVLLK
jgi:hypothetical protein